MIIEICKVFVRKGAPLDVVLDAVHKPYHWWSRAALSSWAHSSSMEIPGHVRWHFGLSHLQEEQGDRGSKEGVSAKHCKTTLVCTRVVCFLDPSSGPGGFPGASHGHERLWRLICSCWCVSCWSCLLTVQTLHCTVFL